MIVWWDQAPPAAVTHCRWRPLTSIQSEGEEICARLAGGGRGGCGQDGAGCFLRSGWPSTLINTPLPLPPTLHSSPSPVLFLYIMLTGWEGLRRRGGGVKQCSERKMWLSAACFVM